MFFNSLNTHSIEFHVYFSPSLQPCRRSGAYAFHLLLSISFPLQHNRWQLQQHLQQRHTVTITTIGLVDVLNAAALQLHQMMSIFQLRPCNCDVMLPSGTVAPASFRDVLRIESHGNRFKKNGQMQKLFAFQLAKNSDFCGITAVSNFFKSMIDF